jgi:hypothetical protein
MNVRSLGIRSSMVVIGLVAAVVIGSSLSALGRISRFI